MKSEQPLSCQRGTANYAPLPAPAAGHLGGVRNEGDDRRVLRVAERGEARAEALALVVDLRVVRAREVDALEDAAAQRLAREDLHEVPRGRPQLLFDRVRATARSKSIFMVFHPHDGSN